MGQVIELELRDIDLSAAKCSETEHLSVRLRLESGMPACLSLPSVYAENGKYIPMTEEQSLLALKTVAGENRKVECMLVSKALAAVKGAVQTMTPEDIVPDIVEASSLWDAMEPEQKKQTTELLYAEFVRRTGRSDREYRRERFRPRVEFINAITKKHMSNSTIVKYLKGAT